MAPKSPARPFIVSEELPIVGTDPLTTSDRSMTPTARQTTVAALASLLEFLGDVDVEKITPSDVERYAGWLAESVSGATAKMHLRVAQQAIRASTETYLVSNEDVRRLVAVAGTDEWKALVLLMADCSVRLDDALGLLWKNVLRRENQLRYRCKENGEDVTVDLASELTTVLERLSHGRGGFLFSSLRHFKKARLLEDLKAIAAAAGLAKRLTSFASFRRLSVNGDRTS